MCKSRQVVKSLKVFKMQSKCFLISTRLNIFYVQSAVSVILSFNSFSSMQVITRCNIKWFYRESLEKVFQM